METISYNGQELEVSEGNFVNMVQKVRRQNKFRYLNNICENLRNDLFATAVKDINGMRSRSSVFTVFSSKIVSLQEVDAAVRNCFSKEKIKFEVKIEPFSGSIDRNIDYCVSLEVEPF